MDVACGATVNDRADMGLCSISQEDRQTLYLGSHCSFYARTECQDASTWFTWPRAYRRTCQGWNTRAHTWKHMRMLTASNMLRFAVSTTFRRDRADDKCRFARHLSLCRLLHLCSGQKLTCTASVRTPICICAREAQFICDTLMSQRRPNAAAMHKKDRSRTFSILHLPWTLAPLFAKTSETTGIFAMRC